MLKATGKYCQIIEKLIATLTLLLKWEVKAKKKPNTVLLSAFEPPAPALSASGERAGEAERAVFPMLLVESAVQHQRMSEHTFCSTFSISIWFRKTNLYQFLSVKISKLSLEYQNIIILCTTTQTRLIDVSVCIKKPNKCKRSSWGKQKK